jgi:hypothetical protein
MRPDRAIEGPRHRLDAWRRRSIRRWDVDPGGPPPADDDVPEIVRIVAAAGLEPELIGLAGELAVAGARARASAIRDVAAGPDPAFAAALRRTLVAHLPSLTGLAVAAPTAPHEAGRSRRFDRLGAPRWTALGVVATLAFVAIGMTADPATRVPTQAHVTSSSAASISGGATSRVAGAGTAVMPGEALVTEPRGRATLVIGTAEIRLAGGSTIELERLDGARVLLVQRAGRAWFRVGGGGTSLTVRTGGVTWAAEAAAFDLLRGGTAGADTVAIVVVEGSVAFDGRGLDGSLGEGRRGVVRPGGDMPDLAIGSARPDDLADAWLLQNAALDRDQGRPLGILADRPREGSVTTP